MALSELGSAFGTDGGTMKDIVEVGITFAIIIVISLTAWGIFA